MIDNEEARFNQSQAEGQRSPVEKLERRVEKLEVMLRRARQFGPLVLVLIAFELLTGTFRALFGAWFGALNTITSPRFGLRKMYRFGSSPGLIKGRNLWTVSRLISQ